MRSQERRERRQAQNGWLYLSPTVVILVMPAEFARAIKEVEDAIEKLKRHFARVKKIAEN